MSDIGLLPRHLGGGRPERLHEDEARIARPPDVGALLQWDEADRLVEGACARVRLGVARWAEGLHVQQPHTASPAVSSSTAATSATPDAPAVAGRRHRQELDLGALGVVIPDEADADDACHRRVRPRSGGARPRRRSSRWSPGGRTTPGARRGVARRRPVAARRARSSASRGAQRVGVNSQGIRLMPWMNADCSISGSAVMRRSGSRGTAPGTSRGSRAGPGWRRGRSAGRRRRTRSARWVSG